MSKNNILKETRIEFYLSFFDSVEGYDEKEINGFWLIKQFDGNSQKWTVHLYSKESYRNYKNGQSKLFGNDDTKIIFDYKVNSE